MSGKTLRSRPQQGMYADWVTDLAMKIDETWRGGPSVMVWEEELAPLHERQAVVAYEKLRKSSRSAPSIADFVDTYQGLAVGPERSTCGACRGRGWKVCAGTNRHAAWCTDPHGCGCHAEEPCACPDGQRAHKQQARIDRQRQERREAIGAADMFTAGPPAALFPIDDPGDF
jgi:hypothetical protein